MSDIPFQSETQFAERGFDIPQLPSNENAVSEEVFGTLVQ